MACCSHLLNYAERILMESLSMKQTQAPKAIESARIKTWHAARLILPHDSPLWPFLMEALNEQQANENAKSQKKRKGSFRHSW